MLSFVLCHDDERMNLGSYEAGHKNYLGLGWGGFTPNLTPSCSSLHHSLHTLHHTLLLTLQLSPLIHNYTIAIIATFTDTLHHILSSSQVFQPLILNPWSRHIFRYSRHITRHTSHQAVYCGDNQEIVRLLKLAAWHPCAQLSSRILYLAARC